MRSHGHGQESVKDYKKFKGLKKQNLRDNMTNLRRESEHTKLLKYYVLITLCVPALSSCMTLPVAGPSRLMHATEIAAQAGMTPSVIATPLGNLQAFARISTPGAPVTVYIEGDGLAWRSRTVVSDDPTPIHPVALELAVQDASANVAYLARPCQYVKDDACSDTLWTNARFSEQVIASMNTAVDHYKQTAQAPSIDLVGFSGGAAVAVLIAQRRSDVASIRTVAGNLDPAALNRYHRVSPLAGSLDPLKHAVSVAHIPQRHFVGANDKLVPRFVADNFKKASGSPTNIDITVVDGAAHMEGWSERWQALNAAWP